VTREDELAKEEAADFFEHAPCGFISTALDGTIRRVNRTFETWTGFDRRDLIGSRRFVDLLSAAGRIYHETHFAPLLRMQGTVSEVAMELVLADGSRMPTFVNSALMGSPDAPEGIRTTIFAAADRRRYEEELLLARREEQEVARLLQESMLSGPMPTAPGFEVGFAYRPAVGGLEIGGDWYDAFWVGQDRIGMVVGDVVGRGIEAAATMGQLRSATRALAATGLKPAQVLDALDAYVARHDVGTMATVVYAEVDLGSGELRYACAGHPPPVVVENRGETQVLGDGRSTPLAVKLRTSHARSEGRWALSEDSMLLLYTDGLIERHDQSIDEGERRLLIEVAKRYGKPVSVFADQVVQALRDPRGARDDVCLLATSFH
jgi:sigma-B regulation protein RsbU (phosphoserine phosphatase)